MEDGKERGHGLAAEYVHGHPKCLLDKQLHTRKVVMCICSVVARCRGCTFKRRGEEGGGVRGRQYEKRHSVICATILERGHPGGCYSAAMSTMRPLVHLQAALSAI